MATHKARRDRRAPARQSGHKEVRLHVVDGASTQAVDDVVRARYAQLLCVATSVHEGFTQAAERTNEVAEAIGTATSVLREQCTPTDFVASACVRALLHERSRLDEIAAWTRYYAEGAGLLVDFFQQMHPDGIGHEVQP